MDVGLTLIAASMVSAQQRIEVMRDRVPPENLPAFEDAAQRYLISRQAIVDFLASPRALRP